MHDTSLTPEQKAILCLPDWPMILFDACPSATMASLVLEYLDEQAANRSKPETLLAVVRELAAENIVLREYVKMLRQPVTVEEARESNRATTRRSRTGGDP